MKATMTKREFNTKMAELIRQRDILNQLEIDMLYQQKNGKKYDQKTWQDLYSRQDEVDAKMDSLDNEYARRNWTASDYAMAEMIAENRD